MGSGLHDSREWHGASRAASNRNTREQHRLLRLQETELEPSCTEQRDREEDEP